MILIKNILIHLLTAAAFVLFWVPVLLLPVWGLFPARRRITRWLLGKFGLLVVRVIWRGFFPVQYEDVRRDKSFSGRIIVVNHRAATDAFLISLMKENCVQTVSRWPLRNPILGPVARLAGYLDVTGKSLPELQEQVQKVISDGDVVVAFPEGTRSAKREMGVFHSGIFHIAKELSVPLGILCIAGNEAMPDRSFCYREFRKILIRRLPDIPAEQIRQMPNAFVLKKAVNQLMKEELARMDRQLDDEKKI